MEYEGEMTARQSDDGMRGVSAGNKLRVWESLLLDTGKRNNLINFKNTKGSTVEVVFPDFATLFTRAEHAAEFEVFDAGENKKADDDTDKDGQAQTKEEYVAAYADKLKKKQILLYNPSGKTMDTIRNIGKKAKTAMEETGVNLAYMAFGFVHWAEKDNPTQIMRAPVLLVPVSIRCDSPLAPCYIKVTDDVLINPSFAFKLKYEYGVELPAFDEELGLDGYWAKLTETLMQLRWWADKECKIGLFSFQKINMYEDLKENAVQVAQSENVRALLGETGASFDVKSVHGSELLQLCNVVDADSSQAEAIALAKAGGSFVLQGPPGTGKSQTITNMIAECIGDGKSVLFVSEKLAALNVVYDKLKKAGLEEFCLELHSHKANKRHVIDEFCRTLRLQKSRVSDSAAGILRGKRDAVDKLESYAQELHTVRSPINKSCYQLFEGYSKYRNAADADFVIENLTQKGEEYAEKVERELNRYAEFTRSVGEDFRQNAWYGYAATDGSFGARSTLKKDLASVQAYAGKLRGICEKVATMYGTNADCIDHAHALGKLFTLGSNSVFITPALFSVQAVDDGISLAAKMRALAEEILQRKGNLDKNFDEDLYRLDGRVLHKKLVKEYDGFFARLFSKEYREIIRSVRLCKNDGKKPKYGEALRIVSELRDYQNRVDEFLELEKRAVGVFGRGYDGVSTDFVRLERELGVLREICLSGVNFGRMARMSAEEFSVNAVTFMDLSGAFSEAAYLVGAAESRLYTTFDSNEYSTRKVSLSALEKKCADCLNGMESFEVWCSFVNNLQTLRKLDLRAFVEYTIDNGIPASEVAATYWKAFYRQWADKILHDSPALAELSRVPHDDLVRSFKEKDELHFEINKSKIREEISSKRPELSMVAQGSAVSVLLREGEKKRNKKGIRALLQEIGELAQILKPCFLMSPLSVSTYLSSDAKFDVVIFDEASQIFPQDAVGAIYRGKQLIVVGDSKQMPPSNFFTSAVEFDGEDGEEEDVADFESVLDLCSASFPQRRLKWHYRSRFEELIAFSNKNFYGNELVTFPSVKNNGAGLGVEFTYAGGIFDRKSKTNRVEAELIVDMVFDHFTKYPERSLGVVAFSISQQSLIERLIDKRRKELPNFEEFFSAERPEPFFVKNLETVQGDERDTIIFSVAYAKDEQGRLYMNFGPINRDGGERRLNVAFTRAKYNIKLVASMRSVDMDISGSKSEGVRLLREYLDYAENGAVALSRAVTLTETRNVESDFESEVLSFLENNGYAVDTQVGCSEYRIDLAVKRPNSSDYVLAIECDGASYHSSKTARDRDRLRQSVLENMGWQFYRIWSTDWFKTPAEEKKRLLAAVNAALAEKPKEMEFSHSGGAVDGIMDGEESVSRSPLPIKEVTSFDEKVEEKPFAFPIYKRVNDSAIDRKKLFAIIGEIVKVEAPVSEDWVLKRVGALYKERKITTSVRNEYKKELDGYTGKVVRKDGFLYYGEIRSCMLRVPAEFDTPREIKYIELQELANGLRVLLARNLMAEKNGLFKLLAGQLGFARLSETAQERMDAALALLGDEVERNGEMLSLK